MWHVYRTRRGDGHENCSTSASCHRCCYLLYFLTLRLDDESVYKYRIKGSVMDTTSGILNTLSCTPNKNTLKTLIKLPDWRKTTHNCRVMGSVWVSFFLSSHTRPMHPINFAPAQKIKYIFHIFLNDQKYARNVLMIISEMKC